MTDAIRRAYARGKTTSCVKMENPALSTSVTLRLAVSSWKPRKVVLALMETHARQGTAVSKERVPGARFFVKRTTTPVRKKPDAHPMTGVVWSISWRMKPPAMTETHVLRTPLAWKGSAREGKPSNAMMEMIAQTILALLKMDAVTPPIRTPALMTRFAPLVINAPRASANQPLLNATMPTLVPVKPVILSQGVYTNPYLSLAKTAISVQ